MFACVSAWRLRAILVSVSPLATVTVEGAPEDSAAGAGASGVEGLGAVLSAGGALAAGALVVGRERRCPLAGGGEDAATAGGMAAGALTEGAGAAGGAVAVAGAVTGADELAFSPGVYTGGSRSTVYSRIRRPRAQFTSTRKVTNGSGIASLERTSKTSRPSLLFAILNVSVERNGGRSMP